MSINPSSPYYLIYLFIAGLFFTPGNIAALLCLWEARGLKSSVFDLFPCLSAFSALTSVEAQFMTPKTASIPLCLAAAYQLWLLWTCFIYQSQGEQEDDGCKERGRAQKVVHLFNQDMQHLCAATQALLPPTAAGLKQRETSADWVTLDLYGRVMNSAFDRCWRGLDITQCVECQIPTCKQESLLLLSLLHSCQNLL